MASSNTPVEPLYSTVVKVKKKSGERLPPAQLPPAVQATSKIKTKEPEILAALPKLEPYEPPTTQLDTSLVIGCIVSSGAVETLINAQLPNAHA